MEKKNLNILVIEDNDDHADIISRYLKKGLSAEVYRGRTLSEGLKLSKEVEFDAALLDLTLPDSEPKETFSNFSKNNQIVPVVILSSLEDEELARHLLKEGAQDYLSKSQLTEDTVARTIRYSIERKSLQKKLKKYSVELEKKNKRLEKLVSISTERLTKSERKYKYLVKNAPLSILVITQSGRLNFANPEFYSLFGYSEEDSLESIFELVPEENTQIVEEIRSKVGDFRQKPFKKKLFLKKKSGEEVWVQINISPIVSKNFREKQFLLLIDDYSDIKKQEEVEKEKKIAEEASQAKTDFLTTISHEIKTPLTAIVGFVDLITHKNRDKALENYLSSVSRNSKHLLFLVKDLLDLAKIESGQLETNVSQFSLVEEIDSVTDMVKPLLMEKPVVIDVKYSGLIPREIQTDLQKFRQILINLINNAVKYTEKGTISVHVQVKYEGANRIGELVINVSDTGLGMTLEHQKHLFKPFNRGDQTEVIQKEGIGVGLSLSKKLALALGGDISLVSSEMGKGSVFEVKLPVGDFSMTAFYRPDSLLDLEKRESVRKESEVRFWLNDRKILVVEDVDDLQFLTEKILSEMGAQVDLSGNGEVAVEKMKKKKYDLVLMDLQMPVKDGFEAIKEIREWGYEGKIIALTAHAFKTEMEKCERAGFDGFIPKPFSRAQLLRLISDHLGERKNEQEDNDHPEEPPTMSVVNKKRDYAEILHIFSNNFNVAIREMKSAIKMGDRETVKRVAHKLKGSSGCYGYKEASILAGEIEAESRNEGDLDWDNILGKVQGLEEEGKKVQGDLHAPH